MHFSLPYPEYNRIPKEVEQSTWFVFSNNDSGWYEKIALNAYPKVSSIEDQEAAVYAFFPLYPLLIKVTMLLTSMSSLQSMIIVSHLISFCLLWLLYLFIKAYTKSKTTAFYAALIWLFFPHHYYFSVAYTEPLFVTLLIWSFYALLKRNYSVFVIASSLLVLTKVNGIFMILPFILFDHHVHQKVAPKRLLIFFPMLISLFSYLFYIKLQTGDFLAFKKISEFHWGGNPQNPFFTLYEYLRHWNEDWHLNYNAVYAMIFLLLSLLFIKRKEYGFFTLAIITILLPLYEGSTVSQPRFISIVFPFALIINAFLKKTHYKKITLGLLLGLHYWSFWFWMTTQPLSY